MLWQSGAGRKSWPAGNEFSRMRTEGICVMQFESRTRPVLPINALLRFVEARGKGPNDLGAPFGDPIVKLALKRMVHWYMLAFHRYLGGGEHLVECSWSMGSKACIFG